MVGQNHPFFDVLLINVILLLQITMTFKSDRHCIDEGMSKIIV